MTTTKQVLAPGDLGSGHAIDLLNQKAIVPSADVWRKQSDNTQAGADSDNIQHSGNVALLQNLAVRSGGDVATAAALDATDKSNLRLTTSGAVGGIAGGEDGKFLSLANVSAADITLTDITTSGASVGTGITIAGGGDLVIRPNAVAYLQYDATVQLWRYIGITEGNVLAARDVGQIGAFELTVPPSGWLALSGQTIVNGAATYSDLADTYPAWVSGADLILPDYRDRHLEGSGASSPGVNLAQATAMPNNPFVITSTSNSTTSGTQVSNGQWGLVNRSGGGSNTPANVDTSPGEPNVLAAPIGHTHGIGGGDAKTRPASRTVLWCVKAMSGVVLSQPGTEVMTNTLVVAGGTVTSIVNGMPATANFAPESRVFFGSQIDPNTVAPVDSVTGVAAVNVVNGETFFQTLDGTQAGGKLAVWKYAGGAWHRMSNFSLVGTTSTADGIRTYYPSAEVMESKWVVAQSAMMIAARGFTAVGGATVADYGSAYGSPAQRMLALNATRPTVTASANTLRSLPTSYIRHEIAVKPTTANHYMLQLLTGGGAREVTAEVWLCNPTTGVPEKRLYGQACNEAGDTNAADCGSLSKAPDNATAYEDWFRQWVGWELPLSVITAYKTASDTIKLAIRPSGDNGSNTLIFVCGYAMLESAHSMIHMPMMAYENTLNIPGNRSNATNGNQPVWWGDYYGYGASYIQPNQNRIFDIPLPDTSKDIYLNALGLWRDGIDTDGYGEPQTWFTIIHASGDVALGRPRPDIVAPVARQQRWGWKPMGFVIPAAVLQAKATQLNAIDAIPYLRVRINAPNRGINAHFAALITEQV